MSNAGADLADPFWGRGIAFLLNVHLKKFPVRFRITEKENISSC